MKEVFLLAMFVMLPVAQAQSPVFPAACGASDVKFDVKLDKSQHTLAQPVTGKALSRTTMGRPLGKNLRTLHESGWTGHGWEPTRTNPTFP
jgi:hypothetical protein